MGGHASAGSEVMPPKKKDPKDKAVFEKPISFRWNTNKYPHHADAMAILKEKMAEGHEAREIFAHALIDAKGLKVKSATNRDVLGRLQRIEGKIDEQAQAYETIIDAMRNMDLSAFVNQSTGRTFREELGERVPDSAYHQITQTVSSADFDVD